MLVSSRFGQRVYNHVKRMEKSEYIILLERFLKGETTHDEERILVDWFKSDVSRDELRNYIQRKWEIASNSSIPTDLKERMFRKIQSRIESVAVEKKDVGRFSLRNIMRYAAIGLLVICAGLGGHLLTRYSRSVGVEKDYLVFAAKGQKASVVLPDGSKVWLNSDSEIKYTNLYGDGERIISLDGEAYFEVTHNEDKPFVVQTNKCNVEVLGTKFNVEAYSDSEDFCTSLMEGSVRVSDKGNPSETLVLAPNQQVSLINGHLQSKSIADFDPFRWKEGLICFKDMNFKELMSRFEKCYGIHVIIENPKLTDYICSGKFRISDGIDKALHILQKDAKYTFERNKDESVIYIK